MAARSNKARWTRRRFLSRVAAGAGGLGWTLARGAAGAKSARAKRKPNFLVIVADDMGFSDAGCYGGEIATPNLDRLAGNGLRFTQMYSTGRCWPSRACILTGYYAQQIRMDPPKGRLPAWCRLAPHFLKPMGYRCYHSGKWHVRGAPMPVKDGGFDHSYLLGDHNRFFSPRKHWADDQALPPVATDSGYYATTHIADRAIQYLQAHARKHADRPFLTYLAFTSPHFPLHALQKDIARYRARYAVGWDAVRQARWRRMREMGLVTCGLSKLVPDASNTPLRLHKSWVHEGGIASPLIVHWPAGLRARGELRHNPGHFVDLLPTILELAGCRPSPRWKDLAVPPMAGRSLAPVLTKDHSAPPEFLYFHHMGNRAIRVGDWKLVAAGKGGPWELYNLRTDRCEQKNLAARHGEKVRELSETWQRHETAFRRQAGTGGTGKR